MRTTSPSPRAPVASPATPTASKPARKPGPEGRGVADWPWQRKKEKEKSGPERAASYCLHERAKEPGGRIISPHRGNRARARPMASPSARATLCAHPHAKAQGCGGAATATPEWNGHHPRPLPGPGPHRSIIHLNPAAPTHGAPRSSLGWVRDLPRRRTHAFFLRRIWGVAASCLAGALPGPGLCSPCFRAAVCSRSCFSGREVTARLIMC